MWITGLPASGKTTLAIALFGAIRETGRGACMLDGDAIRHGLSCDLDLSAEDRAEQARRVAHVAALITRSELVALVALVSPYRVDRDRARALHAENQLRFIEVWIDTPLALCEQRDPKGLYARARAGEISGVTGFDGPYEPPEAPEVRIADAVATEAAVVKILRLIDAPVAQLPSALGAP